VLNEVSSRVRGSERLAVRRKRGAGPCLGILNPHLLEQSGFTSTLLYSSTIEMIDARSRQGAGVRDLRPATHLGWDGQAIAIDRVARRAS